jgi:hypothetical protein
MEKANVDQRTSEWHADRLGRFTASEVYRLMGEVKRPMTEEELEKREKGSRVTTIVDNTLLSDGAMTYVLEVASERITGMPANEDIETFAMRWGREQEPNAKSLYAAAYDIVGTDCGFIKYLSYGGASPDWLIGEDIGCEIKCPLTRGKHMQYRTILNVDDFREKFKDHYWQCAKGMLSTNRKFWKFLSYHPHYPPVKQLKIVNVPRIEDDITLLKIKLEAAEKACQYLLTL